jgi:hypothetical protein
VFAPESVIVPVCPEPLLNVSAKLPLITPVENNKDFPDPTPMLVALCSTTSPNNVASLELLLVTAPAELIPVPFT